MQEASRVELMTGLQTLDQMTPFSRVCYLARALKLQFVHARTRP